MSFDEIEHMLRTIDNVREEDYIVASFEEDFTGPLIQVSNSSFNS